MKGVFKKPYIFWLVGIFVVYLILNILISGFYKTIPLIIIYIKTVDWFKLFVSLILTLAIGAFVAVNGVLAFMKYKERKHCREGAALGGVGAVGGLAAGVCPLCVTGLLPLLFGAFGVGFSFASLPFGGIEIQVLVLIVLIWSYVKLR